MQSQNSRHFYVEVTPDDQLWRVLHAIEDSCQQAAQQFNLELRKSLAISQASGNFTRETVEDAKTAAVRNGFKPIGVRFAIDRIEDDERDWVRASCSFVKDRLRVEVLTGSEVEVNGVFTMLNQAVTQALQVVEPEPSSVPEALPQPWHRRLWSVATTHPLVVTIVGVVAAALIAKVGWFN